MSGWKAETWPFGSVAQVYVILARYRPVERPSPRITARRGRLELDWNALYDQPPGNQRRERARQATSDVGDFAVDIGQQLLAARRRIRKKVFGSLLSAA